MNQILSANKGALMSTIIVFTASLHTFHFPGFFGLRLFEFLSLGLLIILSWKSAANNSAYLKSFSFGFIGLATISVGVAFLNNVDHFHFPQYLGVIFSLFYINIFYGFFKKRGNLLAESIDWTIKIHVFCFMFQFASFYFLGRYIDLVEPITGETQRNIGGVFDGENSIRPSGLFGEPAAYALGLAGFNFILLVKNKAITSFNMFSILSILLSMSALGVVYVGALLTLYTLSTGKKFVAKIILGVSLVGCILIAIDYGWLNNNFLVEKLINYKESGSFQYRIGDVMNDLSKFSLQNLMLGVGLGNLDVIYNKGSTISVILVEQGIIIGIIIVVALFRLLKVFNVSNTNIGYLSVLMLGTHTFSHVQFWFLLITIGIFSRDQYLKKSHKIH